MKRILPLLLLGTAVSAHAADSVNQIYVQPSIASLHIDSSDASGLMTQVGYTYHFTPMLAADVSYVETAEVNNIVAAGDSAYISGYTLAAKVYFPVTYYGAFYGKLGFNHIDLKHEYAVNNLPYNNNSTGTKPYLAVGASSYFMPSLAMNVEYQYMGLPSNNYVSSIGVGLNIFF